MNMMQAVVLNSRHPGDFHFQKVPVPTITDQELLVRMKAIGVGIHDTYYFPSDFSFPYPIGIEGAGIIEEIGKEVADFKVGDRIALVSMLQPKGGTWAEYAAVSAEALILPLPSELNFAKAAAVPVAAQTVLKVLHALQLKPGDSLFIAGASGAIGTFASQLAVMRGCTVAGSASQRNHDYLQALGIEKTVDYHDPDWQQHVLHWRPQGVDAVIATQPGTAVESLPVLKTDGKIIAVSGDRFPAERKVEIKQIDYQLDVSAELRALLQKITEGNFQVPIEKEYPFSEALTALQKVTTRHARGKSIITIP